MEKVAMPRGVEEGSKRERHYEHIKDSFEDRGSGKTKPKNALRVPRARRDASTAKRKHIGAILGNSLSPNQLRPGRRRTRLRFSAGLAGG